MIAAMELAFRCPRCEKTGRASLTVEDSELTCDHCRASWNVPQEVIESSEVTDCLICQSHDLFVRKDFPQRLGVSLVVIGLIASCYAWYHHQIFLTFGILFTTAAIDVVLYLLVSDALVCYCCGAHYRRCTLIDHKGFSLETHERYRQEAARQKQDGAELGGMRPHQGSETN